MGEHDEAEVSAMVKIVNGEIVNDDAVPGPNASAAPNPWAPARPQSGGAWSAPGDSQVTGSSIGAFPVPLRTAVTIAVIAFVLFGMRGLVAAALLAGFNMIKTERDETP